MSNTFYLEAIREYLESDKGNALFERMVDTALNQYLAEHPEETREELIARLKTN